MSVNRVTLLGNVGKAPEIRDGAGGAKFATFSLATTDKGYTKRDGTQVPERTEWHNIVANGSVVQVIERYVTAGTKLYISGKICPGVVGWNNYVLFDKNGKRIGKQNDSSEWMKFKNRLK